LFTNDFDSTGFQWIDHHDQDNSVLSFIRRSSDEVSDPDLVFIFNFTPVPRDDYLTGFPESGHYSKLLDTDDPKFNGPDTTNSSKSSLVPRCGKVSRTAPQLIYLRLDVWFLRKWQACNLGLLENHN